MIPQYLCKTCLKPANVFDNKSTFCLRCWQWLGWYLGQNAPLEDGFTRTESMLVQHLFKIGELPVKI